MNSMDRRYRGMQSKAAGEHFENMIAASLLWYEQHGLACIEKTPEPMKPLRPANRQGQFIACYTKAGQPDFKGTISGGQSVVFEAKHTDDERIKYDRLTDEQIEKLDTHYKLGAVAFVLVSFGLEGFYRIPWEVWRDMKQHFGRKYIKRQEVERYRVPYMAGVIKLLEDVYLDEKCEAWLSRGICPDLCVICGKYAGEGAHVCPDCQKGVTIT